MALKVCPRCGAQYDAIAGFCQRDGSPLTAPDEEPDPYIGRVLLDQFRIEEVVGAGGMGTVYRARQSSVDRDVAIKILHRELVQNPDAVRRFQREARVCTALDHPNVVRVFLFGQLPDASLYLVMEFLRGRSLLDALRTDGPFPVPRALHIATQICEAVGEAHAHGVVHRDIKPENVLLVHRGQDPDFVKVLDFGIARFLWGEQTVITQSGLIFGTARYISPEGAAGEHTDARSDVYSIGVLAYQLLSGETPFDSPSPVALLMKHIHETAPDIRSRQRGTQVPPAVADVVMRALAKNPDARYDDAQQLAQALRDAAVASGLELAMRRASTLPPRISVPISSLPPRSSTPVLPVQPVPYGSAITPAAGGLVSPTLAAAPSPFGESTAASVHIPGLRRRRSGLGTVPTVLLAFVLGAAAVFAGAAIASTLGGGRERGAEVLDLEARARAALARGAIDAPPGESVLDLTSQILARRPDHAAAQQLRIEGARRLREQADVARGQGFVEEARDLYRRALAIAPDDAGARAGLTAIEQAANAPREVDTGAVRVEPASPAPGAPVTIIAHLGTGEQLDADAHPHFHVSRAGRAVARELRAVRASDGTFVASFTFRQPGIYAVVFTAHAGGGVREGTYEIRTEVAVGVAASPPVAERGAPPVTTARPTRDPQGRGTPPPADGIDWRVPPETAPATGPDNPPVAPPADPPGPPADAPPPVDPPTSGGNTTTEPLPPPPPQPEPPPPNVQPPPPPPAPWTGGGWL